MLHIGIECEQIEGETWGVGTSLFKLLEAIAEKPDIEKEYRFHLYFKSHIPPLPFLEHPVFIKKIVRLPLVSNILELSHHSSFSIYFYVLLPIRLWFEKLDAMYFPNNMLPLIFKGTSIISVTPDLHYETYHGTLPFRFRLAYKIFGNWAVYHGTRLITWSKSAADDIARLYKTDPKRIAWTHYGFDAQKTEHQKGDYILYLGQAFPRRHLKECLLAFEKIAPEFPELRFLAFGYDKYNPQIIAELVANINTRLGREAIVHADYAPQENKSELMTKAKAFLYISHTEAFGIPPVEALACDTTPIVADTPLNHELFENAAHFVGPITVENIASTLQEALTNQTKEQDIIREGREIIKKFNWQKHANEFIDIVRHTIHV